MAALAINLLALLIVLGLCWGAMMWLSGRFHGHRRADAYRWQDIPDSERFGHSDAPNQSLSSETPCTVCEGVGAQNTRGKLAPCPACYGTGVLT